MTATGTLSTNKRAQFATDKTLQPTLLTTPSEAVECVAITALTANGSLQELQRTYFRELFTEFIKLKKNLKNLNDRQITLNQDDYVPRSTKFKFQLHSSARLLEESKADVDKVEHACNTAVGLMQTTICDELKKLVKLEIASVQKAIQHCIARSVVVIAITLAIGDPDLSETKSCDIYQFIFDTADAQTPPFLKHSEFSNVNAVYDCIFALAHAHTPAETGTTAYRYEADRIMYAVTATSPTVVVFQHIFQALFVDSWDTFEKQTSTIANTELMKKFIALARAETSTATTAMAIADLDLTNPQTVQDIINQRVNDQICEKTKKLEQQLQTIQRSMVKNDVRGATRPGASIKKKKSTPNRQPSASNSGKQQLKTVAKADAVVADSSKRKSTSRKKTLQKNKPSRNNSRR
ncbi:unnamed protein product [Cylindrotheca closterium]|uniref:Uncharacterized protein n=1 Tax=Cylindrotheca closterium TaxID=2856 RepID=A0AAD2FSF3_9STRA|nr:unnamed protein product [Cylindrotheca closterium]